MVSEPGEGSTFTLDLPLRPASEDDLDLPHVPAVLVVDDEAAARQVAARAPAPASPSTSTRRPTSGPRSPIAARERPSVIFLDLRMPGGTAATLIAAHGRACPSCGGVPVVVVTGPPTWRTSRAPPPSWRSRR